MFNRYDGQFVNNMKDGFGVYEWSDGTKYEGHFKEDHKVIYYVTCFRNTYLVVFTIKML